MLFVQTSGTEEANKLSHILSIVAVPLLLIQDTVNIVLVFFEWNALYMYKEAIFKTLRYMYAEAKEAHR